jgi:dUTP pyrophosphatase
MKIKIKKLHPDAILPRYAHGSEGDAGMDLFAISYTNVLYTATLIPTGIAIELPAGYYAKVCSRSGLALKGIVVVNSPGIIDPSYRGEIKVMLASRSFEAVRIDSGDRIAQLVISRYEPVEWEEAELSESERGEGGFGSSGK